MTHPLLSIDNLSIAFSKQDETRTGVTDLSLQIQRGEGGDGAAQNKRQESERCHDRVGQHVAEDDPPIAHAKRLRGANIVEIAGAQELRAHHAHQRHPAEQDGDA